MNNNMNLFVSVGEDRFQMKVRKMLRQRSMEAFQAGDHAKWRVLHELSHEVGAIPFGEVPHGEE